LRSVNAAWRHRSKPWLRHAGDSGACALECCRRSAAPVGKSALRRLGENYAGHVVQTDAIAISRPRPSSRRKPHSENLRLNWLVDQQCEASSANRTEIRRSRPEAPPTLDRHADRAVNVGGALVPRPNSICRKCYVHPAVFETYLDGNSIEGLKQKTEEAISENLYDLRSSEIAILKFLQARLEKKSV
jgi:hypothetical protein